MKKKLVLIFLAVLYIILPGFRPSPPESPVTGFLDITVESNVNKVLFSYPISERNITSGTGKRLTNIVLPVRDFECNNKLAFKDFLTLLKAEQYPDIIISIPWNALQQPEHEDSVTLKNIKITIAGVSRKYDIYCTAEDSGNGDKILVGTIKIDLNDLNIIPPSKYFGMVKIKDEVFVKFGLGLKDQNYARN